MNTKSDRVLIALFVWSVLLVAMLSVTKLSGCGDDFVPICDSGLEEESYIIDGTLSTDRRSTVYVLGGHQYCSGVILGPHTVATAGHCSGMTDISVEDVGWFEAVGELLHEDYSFPMNDLRLLYFDDILPGPYATVAPATTECRFLLAQGYGLGSNGKLHEREVRQVGYYNNTIVTEPGTCGGDSGGGLYAVGGQDYLIGITSWGYGKSPECDGNSGFTDLRQYTLWLEENVR